MVRQSMKALIWYYIKNIAIKTVKDDALFLASGVAFSILICIIPLILVVFSIVGFTLNTSNELWSNVVVYLQSVIPVFSESIISSTRTLIRDRALIGIIGLVMTAFTATRLFAVLRTVLDTVFEVEHVRGLVHGKLFDFTILFTIGTAMAIINIGVTFLPTLEVFHYLVNLSGASGSFMLNSKFFHILFPLPLTMIMFFITYKFFPSKKPRTDTCVIATVIAGLFWELSKNFYRIFLENSSDFSQVYGTLGALMAVLIWFYLASLIYIIAAQIGFIHEKRPANIN